MVSKTRVAGLLLVVLGAAVALYHGVTLSVAWRGFQAQRASAEESSHYGVEIVRRTSRDGVALKGLLFYDPDLISGPADSVPLVFFVHGMSADYLAMRGAHYTFVKAGYAVFAPENRGHGSNGAPSTLGYEEPGDILDWLDFIDERYPAVNASAAAIWGHSMGAQYALMAYVLESRGAGRFKCVVAGSGPVNLTREVAFLTNNYHSLGSNSLTDHLEEKNPINYVNATFPRNVMVLHGTADSIVDYRCSVDLLEAIDPLELTDPNRSRDDVEFYSLDGQGHGIDNSLFTRQAFRWVQLHVRGVNVSAGEVVVAKAPFDAGGGEAVQEVLPYIFYGVGVALIGALVVAKPKTARGTSAPDDVDAGGREVPRRVREKWLVLYLLLVTGTGWFLTLFDTYLATDLFWLAPLLCAFLGAYLVRTHGVKGKREVGDLFGDAFSPLSLLVAVVVVASTVAWLAVSQSPPVEDAILAPGHRLNWWVFTLWAFVAAMVVLLADLARLLVFGLDPRVPASPSPKQRLAEGFVVSGLLALTFACFLMPHWNATYFIIPAWFSFNLDMVLALVVVFAILFLAFDWVAQASEILSGSKVPGAVLAGLVVAGFIGFGRLILFY
ncbi:MAG: alpha/beta hydrolase family protein [Promethearchaeota archaeon]